MVQNRPRYPGRSLAARSVTCSSEPIVSQDASDIVGKSGVVDGRTTADDG